MVDEETSGDLNKLLVELVKVQIVQCSVLEAIL